jgi:hypothetical protein
MSTNDDKIKELLNQLNDKKNKLGKRERHVLETNGLLKIDDKSFNINTINNPNVIVELLANLISRENNYNEAAKRLNIQSQFTWNGYTIEQWETDFRNRLNVIEYDRKLKELKELENRLNSLISDDGKTSLEIDNISGVLSSF